MFENLFLAKDEVWPFQSRMLKNLLPTASAFRFVTPISVTVKKELDSKLVPHTTEKTAVERSSKSKFAKHSSESVAVT